MIFNIINALFFLIVSYGLTAFLGFGLVFSCLPAKYRSISMHIAPAVGYVAFCFLSIWLSGISKLPVVQTNIFSLAILAGATIFVIYRYRAAAFDALKAAKDSIYPVGVMLVCVFAPLLMQGLGAYIGTANPDFMQSLSLHEILTENRADFWVSHSALNLNGPFYNMFPDAFQARFGGVAFSMMLEQLYGMPARSALMLATTIFLLSLPAAVYFFCVAVLEFERPEALLSALLVAMSAPIAMSFMHTFIGQNSALATFPLAISLIYLAIKERKLPLILLAAVALNGMFWLYVIAIPYVLVPFGLFGALKIYQQGVRSVKAWGLPLAVFLMASAVLHLTVLKDSTEFVQNLLDFLGKLTQSHYYADFLTEEVFIYALGLSSYPISQSLYYYQYHDYIAPFVIGFGIILGALNIHAVRTWFRGAPADAFLLVLSLFAVYAVVWFKYTFLTLYGYASFKMSVWLQFLIIPFFAWQLLNAYRLYKAKSLGWSQPVASLVLFVFFPLYLVSNLATDFDYGRKSMGDDVYHGSIINSYGIGGNQDFNNLPALLKDRIPPESTVALGFGDSIENYMASYYAGKAVKTTSILTHQQIPFEDAILPDIHSRTYVDSLHQTQLDEQKFFLNGDADFYLLAGRNNLNTDIISNRVVGEDLPNHQTFSYLKKSDVKDLVLTGRGFYRVEHMDTQAKSWWWPEVFRWSAEGGEIYHFNPSQPGKPYQIAFSAIAGLGQENGVRNIELWHNGRKFDEVKLDGAARFRSKPYYPAEGVNRLVMRVMEKSSLMPRNYGLWNRSLPRRSTPISILFSQVAVAQPMQASGVPLKVGVTYTPKSYFEKLNIYNGFDVDGWIRSDASFTADADAPIKSVSLHMLIPGNLDFKFPYSVRFTINDQSFVKTFAVPGFHDVDFVLPSTVASPAVSIQIHPQEAKRIFDGFYQREVLQSIQLSSIKLDN